VPATSSPTVKRRRLAAELHACREQIGLTIDDVAQELEWSAAKISRIENARVRVLPRDVKHLLRTYGVQEGAPEWKLMVTLARESHQKGWWHAYGDTLGESFRTYVGLEAAAATLRTYESECIPGLFQTEDYARAIIAAVLFPGTEEDIEKNVAVRMARQSRLTGDEPPELWVVVNEAGIRRLVGGATVMRCQLDRLIETSHLPNVTLQVLPFSAGAHAGMDGGFMILGFAEPPDPEVQYVTCSSGSLFLEGPRELRRCALIFNHLRAVALPTDQSRALISRVRNELT
jgi:transcriptional regulator with XRE-family HTH domain